MVTAHEAYHLHQFRTVSRKNLERNAEWNCHQVLRAFQAKREELLSKWTTERVKIVRVKADPISKKQIAAESALARWERKLKLARTKINKYKRQVNYYTRRQAAKSIVISPATSDAPPPCDNPAQ